MNQIIETMNEKIKSMSSNSRRKKKDLSIRTTEEEKKREGKERGSNIIQVVGESENRCS